MLLYVSYIALRLGRTPEQPFVVPRSFWGSTALLLSISGLLHLAILAARRDQLMQVTIRINKPEVSDIVATFQRYEYNVKYYFGEEHYANELRTNYDNLMNYLKI